MASNAERIAELADTFLEAERLERRHDGLSDRLSAYARERLELQAELAREQHEREHVRFGLKALWFAAQGRRSELLSEHDRACLRIERRLDAKRELIDALEHELRTPAMAAAKGKAAKHQKALDAALHAQRADLEQRVPLIASKLMALEEELPKARAEHTAAAGALDKVRTIRQMLDGARVRLERASELSMGHVADFFKYKAVDGATKRLREVQRLIDELPELKERDELKPIEPKIGLTLQFIDCALETMLAELAVMVQIDSSLEGVLEAEKLFADIEPRLVAAERTARNYAETLERRRRAHLIDAAGSVVDA